MLALSGYEEIDPQNPLGGPDGKKDIICKKGGLLWVTAVHFPNSQLRFSATKKKFKHDLEGVGDDHGGIVFVTNQSLSSGERKSLASLATAVGKEAAFLHLEVIRNLLDGASGLGARLQFLRIPMSIEDQLSWFADSGDRVANAVATNTRELLALKAMVQRMSEDQDEIHRTIQQVTSAKWSPMPLATPDLLSVSSFTTSKEAPPITNQLTPALVSLFHRLLCFDLPTNSVGRFRTREVALLAADGTKASHVQPAAPREIASRLDSLCQEWGSGFQKLARSTVDEKLRALARFHSQFLVIHPFLDGNGRVARGLLMQQCLDLFARADMSLMDKGATYYRSLAEADVGNLDSLKEILRPVVEA